MYIKRQIPVLARIVGKCPRAKKKKKIRGTVESEGIDRKGETMEENSFLKGTKRTRVNESRNILRNQRENESG